MNNVIDYFKYKTIVTFRENKNFETRIYDHKANVILMFDDGWETQYTVAYNYMSQKDMRGSIAVIGSAIGENNYLNMGQLNILYDANWDLLNHTYNHTILNMVDINKQMDAIKRGDEWLKKNGFNNLNNVLIYPEGEYNNDTVTALKKLNYISGRTVKDGLNPKKPSDPYDIKVKNVLTDTKTEWVYNWIDSVIDDNSTLILLFHKIQNDVDDSKMKVKKEDFYKIINYLDKKRNSLNIITYSEWMQIITSSVK
jgi:peptidoglycan/xylan/chitin deacetylase (PgdA/CDA1 family)